MRTEPPGQADYERADRPAPARDWKGTDTDALERPTFLLVAIVLVIAVLTFLLFGVSGVGMLFVALTVVSLVTLVLISAGG